MKKKFIAVYALIGVLALGSTTLTSCVDDNESASVTAVRDAKAAQLNALAAEANANAKVNEALAALKQAEADAQTIKNEFDQQEYAARLEKLQAEYEAAVIVAQQGQATNEELLQNKLYTTYTQAQAKATSLSNEIAEKTVEIAKLQAGLEGAEKYAAKMIQSYRLDSLEAEAEKAAYIALGENDYEALSQQLTTLTVQIGEQQRKVQAKVNETTAAEDAFDDAKVNIYGGTNSLGIVVEPTLETAKAYDALIDAGHYVTTSSPQYVDPDDITSPQIRVHSLDQAAVLRETESLKAAITSAEEALGSANDPAAVLDGGSFVIWTDANSNNVIDAGETVPATEYSIYNYYKKQYEDAVKAWEAATGDAKNAAETTKNYAQATMIDYENNQLKAAQEALEDANEAMTEFNANIAKFSGDDYTAYTTAITNALKTEGQAVLDAEDAEQAEKNILAELNGQKTAINNLITGSSATTVNINDLIADCDIDIAKATKNIEEAALLLKDADGSAIDPSNPNATAQSVIDMAKAELADLEAELALVQEGAAYWKEQLEASLNGTTTSVPETPAEGEGTTEA